MEDVHNMHPQFLATSHSVKTHNLLHHLDLHSIVLPNIRQVVEHWLLRHPEHADNPERSLVLAKSDGARCPFGFLDQRAA